MAIFRQAMRNEAWYSEFNSQLNAGILTAFRGENLSDELLTEWHETRKYEYPWLLNEAPITGRFLDIGHNLQFICALLGLGYTNITAHSTHHDTKALGRLFPWLDDYRGGFFADKCFAKYKHDLTLVLGQLDKLSFIQDHTFDTIYCTSVLEHVPQDELQPLLDGMWRLLKPGGTLAITCDWSIKAPIEEGSEGVVFNHDLGPHLARLGAVVTDYDIPWRRGFDRRLWHGDAIRFEWSGMLVGVYGMVVKK